MTTERLFLLVLGLLGALMIVTAVEGLIHLILHLTH